MVQTLLPVADEIFDAGWTSTGAAFYTEVDETIASADGDTTYVRDDGSDSALLLLDLASGIDPVSSSGYVIRIRARSEVVPTTTQFRVRLDHSAGAAVAMFDLTASYATYEYELSGAEADEITDYTTLRFGLVFGEFSPVAVRLTACELVLPDPPAGGKGPIFQRHPSQRALLRR